MVAAEFGPGGCRKSFPRLETDPYGAGASRHRHNRFNFRAQGRSAWSRSASMRSARASARIGRTAADRSPSPWTPHELNELNAPMGTRCSEADVCLLGDREMSRRAILPDHSKQSSPDLVLPAQEERLLAGTRVQQACPKRARNARRRAVRPSKFRDVFGATTRQARAPRRASSPASPKVTQSAQIARPDRPYRRRPIEDRAKQLAPIDATGHPIEALDRPV